MWSKADFYSAVSNVTLGRLTASWPERAEFPATYSPPLTEPFMGQVLLYASLTAPPSSSE